MSESLIVLNWNQAEQTKACLQALTAARNQADSVSLVAVDNGSTDNSVSLIRQYYPEVRMLETGANLGYAGGNNVGIHYALAHGADVIGILNNDVTVEPGFLDPLLAALGSLPDVGVVTPLVAERDDRGDGVWALGSSVDWGTAAVRRNHAGEPVAPWRKQPPFEVNVASGAAMLVRREVFERAGLLDEAFFLYYEEVDWCMAVRQVGYRILAVPSSVIWHKVSASLGTTSPVIDYYMLRNHLRLINRHWTGPQRVYLWVRVVLRNLLAIAAFTAKPHGGGRIPNRNARLLALRDAMLGRFGKMGPDVVKSCNIDR